MEINSVACLTSLSQNITNSNDNPSLRDIDTVTDVQDEHGKALHILDNKNQHASPNVMWTGSGGFGRRGRGADRKGMGLPFLSPPLLQNPPVPVHRLDV